MADGFVYRDEYLQSPQGQAGQQSGHYLMPMRVDPTHLSPGLARLYGQAEYSTGRTLDYGMGNIEKQMARRGLRTSGIHQQSLSRLLEETAMATAMGRYGMAGEVYGLGLREQEMADRIRMFDVNMQYGQSQAHQQQRGAMWGAVGGLAGAYAGGQMGGGMGGLSSPGTGGGMSTGLSNVFG